MTRRAALRLTANTIVLLTAAVVLACGTPPAAPADAGDPRAEAARLQQTNAVLQRQIELAGGKAFYLVLDPSAPDLALMLRGAELQRYGVRGLQVGQPRVAWADRRDAQPWQGVIWNAGTLDPLRQVDRLVIQQPEPPKEGEEPEPPPVPPTAEELYPVPSRYHIRFLDGLSIEIRPLDADAEAGRFARLWAWWTAKWHDVAAALGSADRDLVRLRIVLAPDDAESLYRALPPDVRLIVLPGNLAAPPPEPEGTPGADGVAPAAAPAAAPAKAP